MTRQIRRVLLTLAPSLFLAVACGAVAGESADRAAIEAAAQAWAAAFNARDADAMAAIATEDVVLLAPDVAPSSGREAARAAWRLAMPGAGGLLTIVNKETVVMGDFAWKVGAAALTLPDDPMIRRGQLLEIWKRIDGHWKIHRQMSSGILTPMPAFAPRPVPSGPVTDSPN